MKAKCLYCEEKINSGSWLFHVESCLHNRELRKRTEDWFTKYLLENNSFPSRDSYAKLAKKENLPTPARLLKFYNSDWSGLQVSMLGVEKEEDSIDKKRIVDCREHIEKITNSLSDYIEPGYAPTYRMYEETNGPHSWWIKRYTYAKFIHEHMTHLSVMSRRNQIDSDKKFINEQELGEEKQDDFSGLQVAPEGERFLDMQCKTRTKRIWNWKKRIYEEVTVREFL